MSNNWGVFSHGPLWDNLILFGGMALLIVVLIAGRLRRNKTRSRRS
ncbi:MAG: hypothetical protein NTX23_09460 [Candidatus Bipolaricaulota bacterium]|nr:hypothetical protein [Candidatus Bipolaricaulota bacterium]